MLDTLHAWITHLKGEVRTYGRSWRDFFPDCAASPFLEVTGGKRRAPRTDDQRRLARSGTGRSVREKGCTSVALQLLPGCNDSRRENDMSSNIRGWPQGSAKLESAIVTARSCSNHRHNQRSERPFGGLARP